MRSNLQKLVIAFFLLPGATGAIAQTITTTVGTGVSGYSGDGGPAIAAQINNPYSIAEDGSGNLYMTDYANNRIRKISTAGLISTVTGTGTPGYSGDGGPASAAQINAPYGITVDITSGNIYFADNGNNRVRKISTSGIITTIAGTGSAGYSGDGGPGTAAAINYPCGVAADGTGVYIADRNNQRIRVVNSSGVISTITGTGTPGFTGDGGPSTAARLNNPVGVSLNNFSDVFIADYSNNRIRKVSAFYGTINTIAGTGTVGFSGDGGPATAAQINHPSGVSADNVGVVYIADNGNNRVRRIGPSTSNITTFAGTGTLGYSGDGGAAMSAMVSPFNVTVVHGGNYVYICGGSQARVRGVDTAAISVAPIGGSLTVCVGATTTLVDATTGGVWSSATPTIATVGSTTGVVTGVSVGVVTIIYTVGTTSVTAVVTVNPFPTITSSATYASCGGVYTLTATGGGGPGYYSWLPATGLSCSSCSTTTVDPAATTVYTVTGSSLLGCSATSTVSVDGNRISGIVSPYVTGSVRVWLVQFNPADSSIIATDSTIACVTGGSLYYEFMDKASGNYLVKAYLLGGTPGSSGYIPTYGLSSAHWDTATTISHSSATDTQPITMIYGTVPSGPGFISGYVVSGAGKGTSGDIPAVNMLIYLRDAAGHVVTYTYTSSTGAYSFGSLANGSYTIFPEAYKYYTTPSAPIVLSTSMETATNINFKQHTTFGTITPYTSTIITHQVNTNPGISVFPNPASGDLNIQWGNQDQGSAEVLITDLLGRQVMKSVLNIDAASGQAKIDLGKLNEGVYLITIKSDKINYCSRLVRTKE